MPRPWLIFVLCAVALPVFAGHPPVQRTQEARVLETARQMLGQGFGAWMIPHLNGRPRLQKPPLAYWMAAGSFSLLGVNDFAGRLPFVLCGMLTLPITFLIARRLFDDRIALLSIGLLLSSYLFFRHMRLAETDAPATLFVTLSISALIAASLAPSRVMHHVAAASMALALLAKGAPIVFPAQFLLLACWIVRRNLVWEFLRSGAIVTLLLIALPWYAYVAHASDWSTFRHEVQNNLQGGDHGKPPWAYLPWLAMATLPWTPLVVVSLIGLATNFRSAWRLRRTQKLRGFEPVVQPPATLDPPTRSTGFQPVTSDIPPQTPLISLLLLTAWLVAVLLPLSITGNKQVHYLLPLMPPLMILSAWIVCEAFRADADAKLLKIIRVILRVLSFGMIGAPVMGWSIAPVIKLCIAYAMLLPLLVGLLMPRLDPENPREVAAYIRTTFPPGPKVFYGPNLSLPLCYNLRQGIAHAPGDADLLRLRQQQPDLLVIAQTKSGRSPPAPPAPFVQVGDDYLNGEQTFRFYRVP